VIELFHKLIPDKVSFAVETLASITSVAGLYIGSTTLIGASCYGVGLIFWVWLMFHKKMWGLLPLNILSLLAVIANLSVFM